MEFLDQHGPKIDSFFRWIHVVAGILWIGLLYFFNWVNAQFAPTLDGDTKKKVVPELMPRALYWFRWGAAWTWITGLVLLLYAFYYNSMLLDEPKAYSRLLASVLVLAGLLATTLIYDALARTAFKNPKVAFFGGWILASLAVLGLKFGLGFGFRAYTIHLGAMFGTFMAFNVWMRIWPMQRQIIAAVKNGQKPEDAWVSLAGSRSKHNTYMSVPLVFAMLDLHHAGWGAGRPAGVDWMFTWKELLIPGIILVGWAATYLLFQQSKKVKGF